MNCKVCVVGPGKFEGEGAEAALLYAAAGEGAGDTSAEGGYEMFRAPLAIDTDQSWFEFAESVGYCRECILAAIDTLNALSGGAILHETDQGFVSWEGFDGSREGGPLDEAWAQIEGDATDDDDDDDDKGCPECSDKGLSHADYPHDPGYLLDCEACEDHCHCGRADGQPIAGQTACVFSECHDDDDDEGEVSE